MSENEIGDTERSNIRERIIVVKNGFAKRQQEFRFVLRSSKIVFMMHP